MVKFAEQCANGDGFLSIDIGGANFGLGGRSHGVRYDFRNGVNGSIELRERYGRLCRIRRAVAEKIMAPSAASCAGRGKLRSVSVDV